MFYRSSSSASSVGRSFPPPHRRCRYHRSDFINQFAPIRDALSLSFRVERELVIRERRSWNFYPGGVTRRHSFGENRIKNAIANNPKNFAPYATRDCAKFWWILR